MFSLTKEITGMNLEQRELNCLQQATSRVALDGRLLSVSKYKNNFNLVKTAFLENPTAIAYASLKHDEFRDFTEFAVKHNGISLYYLPEEFRKDKTICDIAQRNMPREYHPIGGEKERQEIIFCYDEDLRLMKKLEKYARPGKLDILPLFRDCSVYLRDSHVTLLEGGHLIPYAFKAAEQIVDNKFLAILPFSADPLYIEYGSLHGKGFFEKNTLEAIRLAYENRIPFIRGMTCIEGGNCLLFKNEKEEKYALIGELSLFLSFLALEEQDYFKEISIEHEKEPTLDAISMARNLMIFQTKDIQNEEEELEYKKIAFGPITEEDKKYCREEALKIEKKLEMTKERMALELKIPKDHCIFLPQTQFHIDMEMSVTPDGKILLHDDRKTITFLEHFKYPFSTKEFHFYQTYLESARYRNGRFQNIKDQQIELLKNHALDVYLLPLILENSLDKFTLNYCNGVFIKTNKKNNDIVFITTGPTCPAEEIFHKQLKKLLKNTFPHISFSGVSNISQRIEEAYGGVHCMTFESSLVQPCKKPNVNLHEAIKRNSIELVDVLIKEGVDLNVQDSEGNTPLHIAVQLGHLEMATFLLQHIALVDIRNSQRRSPLEIAQYNGCDEMSKLLSYHTIFQDCFLNALNLSIESSRIFLDNINKIHNLEKKVSALKSAIHSMNWDDPLFDVTNVDFHVKDQVQFFEFYWIGFHGLFNNDITYDEWKLLEDYRDMRAKYAKESISVLPFFDEKGDLNKELENLNFGAPEGRKEFDNYLNSIKKTEAVNSRWKYIAFLHFPTP